MLDAFVYFRSEAGVVLRAVFPLKDCIRSHQAPHEHYFNFKGVLDKLGP